MAAAEETEKRGGVGAFIRDTRSEWDKSTFPSSDDVRSTTLVVLISVIFVSVYLFFVDLGWVFLLDLLTQGVNWLFGA